MTDIENKNTDATTPATNTPVAAGTSSPTPTANTTGTNQAAPSVQVPTIKTPTQKRGTKISPRAFGIGCIIFVVILVAMIFAAGYAGLQNPKALATIGMTPGQAKTLLMVVSGAFFGILFFVSFAFLALNIFRLSKVKNAPKGKFIVGIIISFIALGISMTIGGVALSKISSINTEEVFSKNLVIGYVQLTSSGATQATYEEVEKPGVVTVAPVQIYMKVNSTFRLALAQKLGVNPLLSATLSCGNGENNQAGQNVSSDALFPKDGSQSTSDAFDAPCFYTAKGTYNLQLRYVYLDRTSQQQREGILPVGSIIIPAQINLTNEGAKLKTNDAITELIAGDSPARIIFDAKNLFSDVGLRENRIIWDLNGDGIDDTGKDNKAFFSNAYNEGKLYNVRYRLPGSALPLYYYSFPLRVLQSDVPVCTLSNQKDDNGGYNFVGTFPDGGTNIANMHFEVYDIAREQVIQSSPAQSPQFKYVFPNTNQYIVRLVYNTLENKKGFCESDVINANSASYTIQSTLLWKNTQSSQYQIVKDNGTVSTKDGAIVSKETPFDLQVRLDSIVPQPPKDAKINVYLDDQALNAVKSNLFATRIYGPNSQTLKIFIDDGKGNTAEKTWTVSFDQAAIRGELHADKVTGTDPLEVTFDASTITATQPNDEIIYFSWDFDDGTVAKNVSQAKITHTYVFNAGSGSGVFKPKVTVQTKLGASMTFPLPTPISVKRKATTVDISIPSHPTQIAAIGDEVEFSLQTDGQVTSITWDFGDKTTKTCEFRACATTKKTFLTPGTYSVRATVEYQGLPSATNTITLKIE